MKKLVSFLMLSLALVSCEQIGGDLKLAQDLSLKNAKGETRTIRAAAYKADIQFKSEKSLVLKVEGEKFNFSIPKNIPNNGEFSFVAAELGQNVDLSGSVKTVIERSPSISTWESCTYFEYQRVCQNTPNGQVCSNVPVSRLGRQFVSYYDETTNRDVVLTIKVAGGSDVVGDFLGDAAYSRKIYTQRWQCGQF